MVMRREEGRRQSSCSYSPNTKMAFKLREREALNGAPDPICSRPARRYRARFTAIAPATPWMVAPPCTESAASNFDASCRYSGRRGRY
ncbi:hypothetical protein L195_g015526 [Trifolium pratense]|uniref:Uncharacterized protein n=1 Tax=Trifolium pratense TaxID=57577 RepID=A0A2K3MNK9_TRIPR|nr:hypothetical protein L195_g015526 [Trifolium pratense]